MSDFITSCANKTEAAERLSILIKDAPLYPAEILEKESTQKEKQSSKGFHFRSASDLCSAPTVTEWLVKDYIDAGSFSMIFGESGTMKTFVALDLGLSIATGCDWHEQETRKSGPVFYIAGEGFSGINRRIKAWSIHHKQDLINIPFFVSDRPAQFLDDPIQVLIAVDELRKANGEPVLVFIDTLSRNFGSGDENSTKDMARFIYTIDEELRNRYHCAVLILHHTGLAEKDRARGASALRAALDFEYRLSKNTDGTRILKCTKAKDFEEPPTLCLKPEIITLDGWIDPDDGAVMTSCVMVRTDSVTTDARPLMGARKIAYDALLSIGGESVHIDTWRDAAYLAKISSSTSSEAKKKAFQRAATDLITSGHIETKNNYFWPKRDTGQGRDNAGTCPPT